MCHMMAELAHGKYGQGNGQVWQEPRYDFVEVLPGAGLKTMIFEENILCSPTTLSVSSSKCGKFWLVLTETSVLP